MRNDYTRGTLRRPTNLDDLYPDCFGALEDRDEARITRIVTITVRLFTSAIAAAIAVAVWLAYKEFVR